MNFTNNRSKFPSSTRLICLCFSVGHQESDAHGRHCHDHDRRDRHLRLLGGHVWFVSLTCGVKRCSLNKGRELTMCTSTWKWKVTCCVFDCGGRSRVFFLLFYAVERNVCSKVPGGHPIRSRLTSPMLCFVPTCLEAVHLVRDTLSTTTLASVLPSGHGVGSGGNDQVGPAVF